MTDDIVPGLPPSDEFEAAINAKLASAGVEPPASVANPERTRAAHEAAQEATGAKVPGYGTGGTLSTGRPLLNRTRPTDRPPFPQHPDNRTYNTEIFAKMIDKSTFPWIGVLGSAQAAGHEVSVHLRQDPAIGFRGKVVSKTSLSELDEVAAASLKIVKIERDTGNAPRRETTAILLADIVAVTTIEKKE